jgi:hypothetical protein
MLQKVLRSKRKNEKKVKNIMRRKKVRKIGRIKVKKRKRKNEKEIK